MQIVVRERVEHRCPAARSPRRPAQDRLFRRQHVRQVARPERHRRRERSRRQRARVETTPPPSPHGQAEPWPRLTAGLRVHCSHSRQGWRFDVGPCVARATLRAGPGVNSAELRGRAHGTRHASDASVVGTTEKAASSGAVNGVWWSVLVQLRGLRPECNAPRVFRDAGSPCRASLFYSPFVRQVDAPEGAAHLLDVHVWHAPHCAAEAQVPPMHSLVAVLHDSPVRQSVEVAQ